MSTQATGNLFINSFALEGWFQENPNAPKEADIKEAEDAMNFIGEIIGKSYRLLGELDLTRTGDRTDPMPEASFGDSNDKQSVIEIKQFPFEVGKRKGKGHLLFTKPKLHKWFLDFHHTHADEDHRILFRLKIKQNSINPVRALRDLEQADAFAGISTDFLELKAVKWHSSQDYQLTKDCMLPYDYAEGQFIVIEEFDGPLDVDAAIEDSLNYELYVDELFKTWTSEKWDKKFNNFEEDSKFLYLKIIMGPTSSLAILHGVFSLEKFIDTLWKKYGSTKSISQLQGILFFVSGTYQLLELTQTGPILHSVVITEN